MSRGGANEGRGGGIIGGVRKGSPFRGEPTVQYGDTLRARDARAHAHVRAREGESGRDKGDAPPYLSRAPPWG